MRSLILTCALSLVTLAACDGGEPPASPDATPAPDAAPPCVPAEPPAADCTDPCFDSDGPRLVLELDIAELAIPAPPAGSTPIRIGLFYAVAPQESADWTREEAAQKMAQIVAWTDPILAQCQMHVEVETAQVVAIPARLLDHQGNEEGSFGGHPPKGTPNPDLFDYDQNERLTADSLELFIYGKLHTSKNAIAAFTVSNIVYYANQQLSAAGGLSYPPNIYHHVDDYPYRNSVLLVPAYGVCGDLPGLPDQRALPHEIGHMLLSTGGHSTTPGNLMEYGSTLTTEQCDLMRANLTALFGDAEVADPGPPPAGP